MKSKLYRCYDTNLKSHLLDCGFSYELIAKDIVSGKKMWLFIRKNDLEDEIKNWENKSPVNSKGGIMYARN